MASLLIGIHAALGELGAISFLWVLIELIDPNKRRVRRACIAAITGLFLLLSAWVSGGYYYITRYGGPVKQVIKAGPMPWAHSIFMETKEHLFLFLPFLAVLAAGLIIGNKELILKDKKFRRSIIILCGLITVIAFIIAGMGYMISSGARAALGGGV